MKRHLAALLCLCGLGTLEPAAAATGLLDPTPRIAVISAFAPEIAVLQAKAEVEREVTVNGVELTLARLGGREVVLMLSGISMVNAAMSTQLLLDRFAIQGIVFSGIAGGVNPALRIGDVVVPERWGQYLEAIFARETPDGYTLPPYVTGKPPFPNYGMVFPQPVIVRSAASTTGEPHFWFDADPGMVAAARKLAGTLKLQRCAAEGRCLGRDPAFAVGGNGVSGQAFVDNKAFREYVYATFQANVLDMESAAVATVAFANAEPFIIFRSLSDLAGGGEGENEMTTFFQLAADNSAAAVIGFLEAWQP